MGHNPIPVIDIFAGPGGLGEGFSALTDENGKRIFRIVLSIEKDIHAHQTLQLRSFFRQFEKRNVPDEYYEYLQGKILRENLYKLYPEQSELAKEEAWKAELGMTPVEEIDEKIESALKDEKNWALIGGPPCQAYSVIGRVRQRWENGLDEKDPRVFLYREYYRILAVHNPPIFIMENVRGLLSSRLSKKLIFEEILNDLENPVDSYKKLHGKGKTISECPGYFLFSFVKKPLGYELNEMPDFDPEDFIIKSENYGIPQKRHRLIILGIRKDFLKNEPNLLIKQEQVVINKVLSGLPRLRSGLSEEPDNKKNWKRILKGFAKNEVFEKIDPNISEYMFNILKNIKPPQKNRGGEFIEYEPSIGYEEEIAWFLDQKMKGVCNHSTRAHLTKDLYRYLFASCYAHLKKRSPKLNEFPVELLPKHKNAMDKKFEDRFRVQIYGEPSRTITSHISKDGHYYIHPDPTQCRSLTVREAARIQTFPDNYFFCGPRTSQYVQVGNAVPPLLAHKIAVLVEDIFEKAGYIK